MTYGAMTARTGDEENSPLTHHRPRATSDGRARWIFDRAVIVVVCLCVGFVAGVATTGTIRRDAEDALVEATASVRREADADARATASLGASFQLPSVSCPDSKVTWETSLHDVYGSKASVYIDKYEACKSKWGVKICASVGGFTLSVDLPNANLELDLDLPTISGKSYCDAAEIVDAASDVVSTVTDKVTEITDALNELPDKLEERIDDLVDTIYNDVFSASADDIENFFSMAASTAFASSATSSLGDFRTNDVLHPDNDAALRAHVRAAVRGTKLPEEYAHVGRASKPSRSELGAVEGFCVSAKGESGMDDVKVGAATDMPWPNKLASDVRSPNSLVMKSPSLQTKICMEAPKFTIPQKVSQSLVDAFSTVFKTIFTDGVQEVVQSFKDEITDVKADFDSIGNSVDDLKDSINGRRLLSTQDAATRLAELRLDALETAIVHKLREVRRIIADDPLLKNYTPPRRTRGPEKKGAALGLTFQDSLDSALDTFSEALADMVYVEYEQEITFTQIIEATISVSAGQFTEGDLLTWFEELTGVDIERKFGFEATAALLPVLEFTLAYDSEIRVPYFFQAISNGEVTLKLELNFGLKYKMANGVALPPTVTVATASVSAPDSAILASSSFQAGLVYEVNNMYLAVCVTSALCVGPRVQATQMWIAGIDAFVIKSSKDSGTDTDADEVSDEDDDDECYIGKSTLSTVFTDWDYSDSTKDACEVKHPGLAYGIGMYEQIPVTELELTIATRMGGSSQYLAQYTTLLDLDVQTVITAAMDGKKDYVFRELYHSCPTSEWTQYENKELKMCDCEETCPILGVDTSAEPYDKYEEGYPKDNDDDDEETADDVVQYDDA